MKKVNCQVRCYVHSATNLASRDEGGLSDPYLVVKLGDKKERNYRDNYIEDEVNPDIGILAEFDAVFPGCPELLV